MAFDMGTRYSDLSAADKAEVAETLCDIGMMYSNGDGVEPDLITAHTWFNLAAHSGDVVAREHRADISREMSAAEIAAAQRMARDWLQVT